MNTFCHVESPIGRLLLTSDGIALTGLFTRPEHKGYCTEGWVEDATIAPLAMAACASPRIPANRGAETPTMNGSFGARVTQRATKPMASS